MPIITSYTTPTIKAEPIATAPSDMEASNISLQVFRNV